ncbi:MAG: hypothetical protein AVDCRST_MAG38-2241, partial [uncultured Solirubrobacteraceae bacterium]
ERDAAADGSRRPGAHHAAARRRLAAGGPARAAALVGVAGVDDRRGRRRPGRRPGGQLAQPRHLGGVLVRRGARIHDDHLALQRLAHALGDQRAHGAAVGRRLLPAAGSLLPVRVVRAAGRRQRDHLQRFGRGGHDLSHRAHAAARLGQAAPCPTAGLRRDGRRGDTEPDVRGAGRGGTDRPGRRRSRTSHPRSDRRAGHLGHLGQGVRRPVARGRRRLLCAGRLRARRRIRSASHTARLLLLGGRRDRLLPLGREV